LNQNTEKNGEQLTNEKSVKRILNYFSGRLAAIALGSAVVLAGSAVAFTKTQSRRS
jgi:hypothetical protein